MKLQNKIIINKPIEEVWQVLATDFDKASDWMSAIPYSIGKTKGQPINGAPMVGRVCDLSTNPNGAKVDETILAFDEKNHKFTVQVTPVGAKLPIEGNRITFQLKEKGSNQTEVVYDSNIALKTVGKVLFPVLKIGINKSFDEQLEELKFYVEQGKPHPRKIAKAA